MVYNPNSPWRNKSTTTTISAMDIDVLNIDIAEKQKEGYKVVNRKSYPVGNGQIKYTAIIKL